MNEEEFISRFDELVSRYGKVRVVLETKESFEVDDYILCSQYRKGEFWGNMACFLLDGILKEVPVETIVEVRAVD